MNKHKFIVKKNSKGYPLVPSICEVCNEALSFDLDKNHTAESFTLKIPRRSDLQK